MSDRPAFTVVDSKAVPLLKDHVDTDQIIPGRFLTTTSKDGLADFCFHDWRQQPDFILNQPEQAGREILLAGDNFGCGSSREHAPWALRAYGFRAVIARSFADIFKGNALKNGLLPVELKGEAYEAVYQAATQADPEPIAIDLEDECLRLPSGQRFGFSVDPFSRDCLLKGVDQLGYLLGYEADIKAYEESHDA